MNGELSRIAANAKGLGLWLYRAVTSVRRRHALQQLKEIGRVPIAILFYHRVANDIVNEWTISRRDFVRQLDWLGRHFDIVSLSEAQLRIKSVSNNRPTVALTFDDGYADNCDFAIGELCRRKLPATYFVASDFVSSGEPFPHDLLAGHPLPPNTVEQLRDIASRGIEIGGHTRGHIDLGKMADITGLRREIQGNARQLERWLRVKIRYFSFPYGLPENISQRAVDVIMQSGFKGYCTAYGAWNWPGNLGIHLKRIHADPGLDSLRNWLTLDPRKLRDQRVLPFVEMPVSGSASNENSPRNVAPNATLPASVTRI